MKSKLMMAVLCGGLFASALNAFATTTEDKSVAAHFIARAGETESSPNYREIFVYSKEKLKNVQLRFEKIEGWSNLKEFNATDYSAYGTTANYSVADGNRYLVRGVREDGVRVTDLLITKNVEGTVSVAVEGVKEESAEEVAKEVKVVVAAPVVAPTMAPNFAPAPARTSTAQQTYGNDAQSIAQSRANQMASRGVRGHLDSGVVSTSQGRLFEGVGWGFGNVTTCQGSGAPVADATAYGANGEKFRVRLYTTPTAPPGGGGMGFGRRGRR